MVNLFNINWRQFNILDVIKGCAESWLVHYNLSPEKTKQLSHYRMSICEGCHMNKDWWCDNSGRQYIRNVDTGQEVTGCGCQLKCKTVLFDHACPAGLWKAVPEPK